ncbi:MAG: hypothetical protein AAF970_12120 [Bacteroidota bacterium]
MRFSFRHVASSAILMLLLMGCDSVGSETVTLVADNLEFEFEFNSNDVATGALVDLRSRDGMDVDLGTFLASQGFSKADILAAQVEAVRLEIAFPISARATFLESAILKLEANGLSATEIAQQSTFPNERGADFEVVAGRDIGDLVNRSGGLQAILQVNARELAPNTTYELGVSLRMRIELDEG